MDLVFSHSKTRNVTAVRGESSLYLHLPVGRQLYKTDASQEYVIVGNDAILKCQYPSFVSDFLTILGWADSEGEFYSLGHESHNGSGACIVWMVSA